MTMQHTMRRAWSGPTQDDFAAIERLRARHASRMEAIGETQDEPIVVRRPIPRLALLSGAGLAALVVFGIAGLWATGTRAPSTAPLARERAAPAPVPSPDQAARMKLAEAMRIQDSGRDAATKPSLAPEEAISLRARAASLIEEGRIAGARATLERAAQAGDAQALFQLARTFDPQALVEWKTIGVAADEARALDLYRRAAAAGSLEAVARANAMAK
ncbi:MAG: hypothetical protein U1E28_19880 [Beijerinckiaceae bacterium]